MIDHIMPESEVDKFISLLREAFKNGQILLLGEIHGEEGTYDLFLHPKVQAALLALKLEYEKSGKSFSLFVFLELPPNGSIENYFPHKIKTVKELLDSFNKGKNAETTKLFTSVLKGSTAFQPPGFVEKKILVYQFFAHSLGAKLVAGDVGAEVAQSHSTKPLETRVTYRNHREASLIHQTQQQNPNSLGMSFNGMDHLFDNKKKGQISLKTSLNKLANNPNYSSSIVLRPNPRHEVDIKEVVSYNMDLESIRKGALLPTSEVWVDNYAPEWNVEDFFKDRANKLFFATYGKNPEFLKNKEKIIADPYLPSKIMQLIMSDLILIKRNDPYIKKFLDSQNPGGFTEHFHGHISAIGLPIMINEFYDKFGINKKEMLSFAIGDQLYNDALRQLNNAIPAKNYSKFLTNYGVIPK